MSKLVKIFCSWPIALILIIFIAFSLIAFVYQLKVICLLSENIQLENELVINSYKINTKGYKIAFIDYFDCSDSVNTVLLINGVNWCAISNINFSNQDFNVFADSLNEVQRLIKDDLPILKNIYEIAGDTVYYYQPIDKYTRVCLVIPEANILIQVTGYIFSQEEIQHVVNRMIYYDKADVTWKLLE